MTEPLHNFLISFWTESSHDFAFLQDELTPLERVELTRVINQDELIDLINSRIPQLLVVDVLFENELNELLSNQQLDKINKIVMTTGMNTVEPNRKGTVPILPLTELIFFIRTLQAAQRLSIGSNLTSNSLYTILVDYVKDLIFFKDTQKRYVMINRSFSSHYGLQMVEILGKNDYELFSDDINTISEESDNYVLNSHQSITFETSYFLDSRMVHIETIKTPVISDNERIIGIVGISRDITAKRMQEDKLRRNALLLNQSELLTNSGSFEIKQGNRHIQCSEQFRKMMDLDINAPISIEELYEKIHKADREIFKEKLKDTLNNGRRNRIDHRIYNLTTSSFTPCQTILNIDTRGKSPILFGTMLDMSEIRQNQQAILDAQENERKTLAANLHDGLIQKLVAANMYISSLEEGKHDHEKLTIAKELINSSIEETRSITRNLSLRNIENLGLKNAVLEVIESYPMETEITYHFDFEEKDINPELSTTIYRIFQETIANIMKYAHASSIDLLIQFMNNHIHYRITDDGIGFTAADEINGNGLKNIRQRVAHCHGNFDLQTSNNQGTIISIKLPII